jgi:hypothetical protein
MYTQSIKVNSLQISAFCLARHVRNKLFDLRKACKSLLVWIRFIQNYQNNIPYFVIEYCLKVSNEFVSFCGLRSYLLSFMNNNIVKDKWLQLLSVSKLDTTLPITTFLICILLFCSVRLFFRQMTSWALLGWTQIFRARITSPASNARCRDGVNEIGWVGSTWKLFLLLTTVNNKVHYFSTMRRLSPTLRLFVIHNRKCCRWRIYSAWRILSNSFKNFLSSDLSAIRSCTQLSSSVKILLRADLRSSLSAQGCTLSHLVVTWS